MSDKESADYNIDELVKDIKAKYLDAAFGKYRVTTVDSGTLRAVFKKLNGFFNKRDVKIIFLVAEEINGQQTQCF